MSVNANSFPVQCSVIVLAAFTRDRVLHFLRRKKKFYSLNFHVIDIKHLFQCNRLLYYLKKCFLPNTWAGQQYQNFKHGGDIPVVNEKMTLGQVVTNFTRQDVCECWRARAVARVCVCVRARACVLQHHSRIHHTSSETMHLNVYIKRKFLSFL